jgi:hypothetical protein
VHPDPTPGLKHAVDLSGSKKHEDALRALVQQRVAERFGKDVSSVETKVWWVEGELRYKGGKYGGLTYGCGEIYVRDTGDLCYSSYIHELLHCYHSEVEGWRDFKHVDKKWWSLVKPLKAECIRRGW